jgi:hypothetical protein
MIILVLERDYKFEPVRGFVHKKIMMDRNLTTDNCVECGTHIDFFSPLRKIKYIRDELLIKFNYPIDYVNPADAANYVRRHAIVNTQDPFVIDVFNLELLKNPKINLEAFEAIPAIGTKPISVKVALIKGQINTDILSAGLKMLDAERKKFFKKKKK